MVKQNTRFIRYNEDTESPEIFMNRPPHDMSNSNYIEVPIQDVYLVMVHFIISDDNPVVMKLVEDADEFIADCSREARNIVNAIRATGYNGPLLGGLTIIQDSSAHRVFRFKGNDEAIHRFDRFNRFLFRLTV